MVRLRVEMIRRARAFASGFTYVHTSMAVGAVEKVRQRRSRPVVVLTYAPRANGLAGRAFLNSPLPLDIREVRRQSTLYFFEIIQASPLVNSRLLRQSFRPKKPSISTCDTITLTSRIPSSGHL